jgi:thiamine biosynthesis lipoprotein
MPERIPAAFFLLCCSAFFLSVGSCVPGSSRARTRSYETLDTTVVLTVYGTISEAAFKKIKARLDEISGKMSKSEAGSEVNAVNAAAGSHPVPVSPETYEVMKRALYMARLSNGAFDPTIGPIVDLWDIEGDTDYVPTQRQISELLPLVDWKRIVTDDAKRTIFLTRTGMKLDFGGIAKGYAADEALRIAKAEGVASALFSMGESSIIALGLKPGDAKWRIGVTDPFIRTDGRESGRDYFGVFDCADAIVGSSGPYVKYFVKDGKRYHHIMNPKTGWPVENGLEQVTVVMPASVDLPDGLTAACFVLGLEAGMSLIDSLPGIGALFVTSDRRIHASSRIGSEFSFTLEPGYEMAGR